LDSLKSIKVCTAYRIDGKKVSVPPASAEALARVEPIYRTFKGWQQDTSECRRWQDLPAEARLYLNAISELIEAPLGIISVGPDRDQTFTKKR